MSEAKLRGTEKQMQKWHNMYFCKGYHYKYFNNKTLLTGTEVRPTVDEMKRFCSGRLRVGDAEEGESDNNESEDSDRANIENEIRHLSTLKKRD